jgi:hypothetical protein
MIDSAYQTVVHESAALIRHGMAKYDVELTIIEKYGRAAVDAADRRLRRLVSDIENAADWSSLNHSAALALSPLSFTAGVLAGVTEGVVGDVAGLLGLGRIIILAGVYDRMNSPLIGVGADPITLALVVAARNIPWFRAQTKAAYEQFQQIQDEILKIAHHPLDFIEAVGEKIWAGAVDDFRQLREYATHRTVWNDFQAGRIVGRVLYRIVSTILIVITVAGAAAKLASKCPAALRLVRLIRAGGVAEDGVQLQKLKQLGETAADLEKVKPPLIEEPPPVPKSKLSQSLRDAGFKKEIPLKKEADLPGGGLRRIPSKIENGKIRRILSDGKSGRFTGTKDFVLTTDGRLRVGSGHSVLSNGEDVAFAGQLKFDSKGVLREITNSSGHYLPESGQGLTDAAKRALGNMGVDVSNATVNEEPLLR